MYMFRCLISKFMNLSLTPKIITIYLLTIILPTFILFSVLMKVNIDNIEDIYYENQNNTMLSAKETFLIQLNQAASNSIYFQAQDILSEMLLEEHSITSSFIFHLFKDIKPVIATCKINPNIQTVRIIGLGKYPFNVPNEFSSVEAMELPTELVEQIQTNSHVWHLSYEEGTSVLHFYQAITRNSYPYFIGIINFEIDFLSILDSFHSQVNTPIYINLENEQLLVYNGQQLSSNTLPSDSNTLSVMADFQILLPDSNFALFCQYNPMEWSSFPVKMSLAIIAICLLFFTSFYYLIRVVLLNRLNTFTSYLKTLDVQALKIFPARTYADEVGYTITAYNELVGRLNHLIHENLVIQFQKREADYYALQAQIKPHFLYNTLENIRMNAEMHNDSETGDMLMALGQHMRYTMNSSRQPISLEKELLFARNYLKLYKIRMKEKLNFEILISCEINRIYCPRFLLQPLLENSLRHGYNPSSPLFIRISITELSSEEVEVVLEDNGNGIPHHILVDLQEKLSSAAISTTNHVGLLNVNSRLIVFSDKPHTGICLESTEGRGTRISFSLYTCTINVEENQYENINCR